MTAELSFAAIVPTYNRAHLLPDTLASLLGQSHAFKEIIVVDDGSTDGTPGMLARDFPMVRVVVQSHAMVQRARNRGAALAQSRWLVFCDSDDLLDSGHVAAAAALLERHPELDAIFADHAGFDAAGVQFDSKFAAAATAVWDDLCDDGPAYLVQDVKAAEALCSQLVPSNVIWPTGMLVRKDFYDRIGGFDPRMAGIRGEDFEFTVRALRAGQVALLKQPRCRIRYRDRGSRLDQLRQDLGEAAVLQFILDRHDGTDRSPAFSAALRAGIAARRRGAYYAAFLRGDWRLVAELAQDLSIQALTPRERFKLFIQAMPPPLRKLAHAAALRAAGARPPAAHADLRYDLYGRPLA